jgi:hypothetical protein
VLINIIHLKLQPYTENIIEEYQAGLGTRRSITDQLFAVTHMLEKCWKNNIKAYQISEKLMTALIVTSSISLCMKLGYLVN